ncbi:MAG: 2OG-Fe(II) oxygenase [Hyphomicrobiaceae bacterium]
MANRTEAIADQLISSIEASESHAKPYPHWFLTKCLPTDVADEITELPFPAPALGGLSGKRELHNATRKYFDGQNRAAFPVVEAFAQAFQSRRITDRIQKHFGTSLADTYLRLEYAQDTNGFWLEPHTDLGVKVFTMLLYLSKDPSHRDLGTDIYDSEKHHIGRSPFAPNAAMVFVPSNNTYHGFEPRQIEGVRKSIIINYVTSEWRAREQLSFPEAPITG